MWGDEAMKCLLITFGTVLALVGCNSVVDKRPHGALSAQEANNPDYSAIQTKILQPYCVACHGSAGGLSLESYASVKAAAQAIFGAVAVKRTMPPGSALPGDLVNLLDTWIKNGTPEVTSSAQMPLLEPETAPVTFSKISKNILQPKCSVCHPDSGKMPVLNYDFLTKNGWVTPGKPQDSELYRSITSGRMPPGRPLDNSDITEIGDWITNGAQK
jgi:uncharacterized membrane protein